MSRGRKAIVHNNSDWESVFYNSVGTYVQYINLKLAEQIKSEPLSNHIRIAGGYAFKSSQYKKQGVPVIRISDFSNEKIVLDDVVYYEESEALERYELHEGDIVIALTGGTIAKLGIVQKGIGKLYLNQRVGKFEILNPDEFETEYIYWIARSVQSIIKDLAWGAAIPNVSPKQIEELQFPIPDKETQHGIIYFLNDLRANKLEEDKEYFNSEVEDFIFNLQVNQISGAELHSELLQQENLLKQLRLALLQDGVQGKLINQNEQDGNATELLERIKIEKENLIKEKKIRQGKIQEAELQDDILFDIPSNWVWCKLDDLCWNITDGTHITPIYTKSGRIFLSAQNIKPFRFMPENHKLVSEDAYQDYIRNRKAEKGDVLVTRVGAGIGEAAVIDREIDFCFYVSLGLVQPFKKHIDSNYLTYVFNSPYGVQYAKGNISSKGGSAGNFNLGRIRSFLVPLPPLVEQKRIVNRLDKVMSLCDELFESIKQSNIEIERLIKTLLNDALGVTTIYDVAKDKTLKQEIRKFQTTDNTFERISMNIIEILQSNQEPISATVVWNSSKYSKDIEAFYAELKRLIDIEKLVVEEKHGRESFLKLASNEN